MGPAGFDARYWSSSIHILATGQGWHNPLAMQVRKQTQKLPVDLFAHERDGYSSGFRCIAGIDEAGRGPLAGPVVAACVVLEVLDPINGVADSKALTPAKRDLLHREITTRCVSFGVAIVDAETIDRVNILQATLLAMRLAFANLANTTSPDLVLIDGNTLPRISNVTERALIGGDAICASIAAASIVAKVTRDRLMVEASDLYPQYGFASHKGYGSAEHLRALREHGPCPLHRRSFGPVSQTSLLFSE